MKPFVGRAVVGRREFDDLRGEGSRLPAGDSSGAMDADGGATPGGKG